ncbi:phage holin, LLH family [Lactobacillus sp. ESL0684]|uniref:phage holin, LLH family n=1 Tax=Lactobacillus sp. ESL0684 TaxID=2983213 RepID=UPI0023F9F84C|nr:phage holin, LLH family [Lactobacillus sp. ESL0684]WEV42938.1 phage holin, LLH family [Lactobacillus sp. ESL0684]
MSTKEIFDLIYAVLVMVAIIAYIGVKLYSQNHTIKNKWVAQIPDLAAAFVHEAETTDGEGTKKMDAVINEVSRVLAAHNIKVDPTIEAAIRAYAEQEVAKMNADKSAAEPDTLGILNENEEVVLDEN